MFIVGGCCEVDLDIRLFMLSFTLFLCYSNIFIRNSLNSINMIVNIFLLGSIVIFKWQTFCIQNRDIFFFTAKQFSIFCPYRQFWKSATSLFSIIKPSASSEKRSHWSAQLIEMLYKKVAKYKLRTTRAQPSLKAGLITQQPHPTHNKFLLGKHN